MGAITMSEKEQKVYELALQVLHHRLTIVEFSILTRKSYSQSKRIIKKIKETGMLGVKHGNLGCRGVTVPNPSGKEIKLPILLTL